MAAQPLPSLLPKAAEPSHYGTRVVLCAQREWTSWFIDTHRYKEKCCSVSDTSKFRFVPLLRAKSWFRVLYQSWLCPTGLVRGMEREGLAWASTAWGGHSDLPSNGPVFFLCRVLRWFLRDLPHSFDSPGDNGGSEGARDTVGKRTRLWRCGDNPLMAWG